MTDVAHITQELPSTSNIVDVNQAFIWPLNSPLEEDEKILIELRTQTTKILLKTGLGATKSGSSGTISSSSKCIGKYVIFTQGKEGIVSIYKFYKRYTFKLEILPKYVGKYI